MLSGTPTASGQFSFGIAVSETAAHGDADVQHVDLSAWRRPAGVLDDRTDLRTVHGRQRPSSFRQRRHGAVHYALAPAAPVIPGMRVQDGQPLPTTFPGGTTAGYIGVIAAAGTYTTSIRVTDAASATYDRAITIHRVAAQHPVAEQPAQALAGTPYSFTMMPSGGTSTYAWSASGPAAGPQHQFVTGSFPARRRASGTFFPNVTVTDVGAAKSVAIGYTLTVDPFAITTAGVLPQGTVAPHITRR